MNTALLSLAAELVEGGRPFAVATVVRREAPSSSRPGDTAIVTDDGELHGFIGGRCTRATVVEQAMMVLACREPRLIAFCEDDRGRADDIVGVPMTCHSGGSVEIYIDPVFPVPRLLLLGVSPVNEAIARLGKSIGYAVHVGCPEDGGDLPADADELLDSVDGLAARYRDRPSGVRLYALVATMGEADESMLIEALAANPDYLGVIASRRRMEEIRTVLAERGVEESAIGSIHGPAGLDLGAIRPEEIAISILAQIVALERRVVARSADDAVAERPATQRSEIGGGGEPGSAATPTAPTQSAAAKVGTLDPVCGMKVTVGEATPRAEHDGTTHYFCCSGCRDRFVDDPAAFAVGDRRAAAPEAGADS